MKVRNCYAIDVDLIGQVNTDWFEIYSCVANMAYSELTDSTKQVLQEMELYCKRKAKPYSTFN